MMTECVLLIPLPTNVRKKLFTRLKDFGPEIATIANQRAVDFVDVTLCLETKEKDSIGKPKINKCMSTAYRLTPNCQEKDTPKL